MALYLLIFIGTLGLSLFAAWRVKAVYRRYAAQPALSGLTGAQAAARVLAAEGIRDVEITAQPGELSDHYDPLHKRLVLSEENYFGKSIAAVSVAAHEAGHAVQHARAYAPLHWRMMAVGATRFASQLVLWLPLLGLATGLIAPRVSIALIAVGWGVIMLFNLVTLPVEFDASRRAKLLLSNTGIVAATERTDVDRVLNAAAMTYVAAFITSLAYLLYYLLPLLAGNRQ